MNKRRFDIGNGVTHATYGDGHIFATGDKVMVKFLDGTIQIMSEDELVSNPKIGLMRDFNSGKRQYPGFKGSQKGSLKPKQ